MLTIITACCRPENIPTVYKSIHFDKIHMWIIVYDTSNGRTYPKLYMGNSKILEVECMGGIVGNPQRNYGMSLVSDGFLYFLDDDNLVHPTFWSILESVEPDYFYTFDQAWAMKRIRLTGNNIKLTFIDTAMFLVHKRHVRDIQWKVECYHADGQFIMDIAEQNSGCHKYIQQIGCYYNLLSKKT